MSGIFQVRPKGKDAWYRPDRDILRIWPLAVVRGAAYACDKHSSVYGWLSKQHSAEKIYPLVEKQLRNVLVAMDGSCTVPAEQTMTQAEVIDWPAYQAIMMGASASMTTEFSQYFRESRLKNTQHGGVSEVGPRIDLLTAMAHFAECVKKFNDASTNQ